MKKKSKLLFSMFLVSGLFLFATANTLYADPIYVGTVVGSGGLPYMGTGDPDGVEDAADVNSLIDAWNTFNKNSFSHVSDYSDNEDFWDFSGTIEVDKSGTVSWKGEWKYLTVKYGQAFDLFYIGGDDQVNSIDWVSQWIIQKNENPQQSALSHIRLWDGAAPVPEPATMLLLGSGLLGLAGFGRKKFKK